MSKYTVTGMEMYFLKQTFENITSNDTELTKF